MNPRIGRVQRARATERLHGLLVPLPADEQPAQVIMRREVFFVQLDGPAQQSLGLFDFAARVGDVTEVGDHVGVVGLKGERAVEGRRRVVYSLSILFSIIKQQSTSAPRQS